MTFTAVRRDLTYEDRVIHPAGMLAQHQQLSLRGCTFNRCRITGPAVFHLMGHVSLSGCQFEAPDVASMLWEIPAGVAKVGAIDIWDSSFRRCLFEGVGFVGTAEELAAFREMVEG